MSLNETTFYAQLGNRIRLTRAERAMRQQDLADLLGLSRTTITSIETGNQKIPAHLLVEIALALDVEIMDLLPSQYELERNKSNLPLSATNFLNELDQKKGGLA